jgi:hypothetical protein
VALEHQTAQTQQSRAVVAAVVGPRLEALEHVSLRRPRQQPAQRWDGSDAAPFRCGSG